jgi:hypothetical protein
MPHTGSFTIVAVVIVNSLMFRTEIISDGSRSTEQECSNSLGGQNQEWSPMVVRLVDSTKTPILVAYQGEADSNPFDCGWWG